MLVTSIVSFSHYVFKNILSKGCLKSGLRAKVLMICHATNISKLPNDKVLDISKLEALADDKLNMTQELEFNLGCVKNIVGKGENAFVRSFTRIFY